MTFTVDEAYLPATLTAPQMSDEEFAGFCAKYPDYFIEMTAEGQLLIMPPNYSITSLQNAEITFQLAAWTRLSRLGLMTESSGGFVLPSGARRSPDVAWISRDRVEQMPNTQRTGYWHLCPDFVVELGSKTDRLPALRAKMQEWIANGAQLAWLIDPERKAVEVYRPGVAPDIQTEVQSISASSPLDGFTLDLTRVWDPLS